jgi:ATP-dependent exoDNAse (exonuclease V) beta subunit
MATKKTKPPSPTQIFVTEASAGSGKTYALAKRYIQLLLNPKVTPDEMPFKSTLAITFTNKATIEMKERILEFLKRIALGQFKSEEEEEDIFSALSIERKAAQNKADLLLEFLFRNYNFFAVKTIDSFITSILKGCSLTLNLSSGFNIKKDKNDYQEYLAYCFDALIDKAVEDKSIMKIFRDFLVHFLEIEQSSGWNPKKNILEEMSALFEKMNTYGKKPAKFPVKGRSLIDLKGEIYDMLLELKESIPKETYQRFQDSLNNVASGSKESFAIGKNLNFMKKEEIPVKKGYVASTTANRLFEKIKNNIAEYVELEAYSFFNPYIDILDPVIDELRQLEGKDDIIFLSQLNSKARSLFKESSITVPEIYLRIATRFRNYLIDEFQDTNQLQWDNLYPMVKEAVDSGGTLFYVGDKKQAIYRFRGGNVELFDEVKDDVFSGYNVQEDILKVNYRSQKEIVEWNNKIFHKDNLKRFLDHFDPLELSQQSRDDIYDHFKGAQQEHLKKKDAGYVRVENIDGNNIEDREPIIKEKVLALLNELKGRFDWGNIAILTRDNKEIEVITEWLLGAAPPVPVESDKTLSIKENSVIKELVSFIAFLLSPIDNLSFASFILGDIFQKKAGIDRKVIEQFLFELGKKRWEKIYYYREFRKAFPSAWSELIDPFFKSVGFFPMYEFIISMLDKFDVLKNFPEHQAFIMKFIELVKEKEKDEASLDAFMDFFESLEDEKLYVYVTRTNAVKIETIHKSKGLDFGVVILPFLGMEIKPEDKITEAGEDKLALISLNKEVSGFSDHLNSLYHKEWKRSLVDELNTTYVAFTRAKYELYVFVPNKIGNRNNIARDLIPEDMFERGSIKNYTKKQEEADILKLPISLYKDWLPLLKGEFIDASRISNREKLLRGDALHSVLSFIGDLQSQDKEAVLSLAIERAKSLSPDADMAEIGPIVRNTISHKDLKDFFYVAKGEVFQEKEFITKLGGTERMDRLIVTSNEVRILDYKSSRDSAESHVQQVRSYMEIMKELYPEKDVRGFLFYLDELALEEIPWNA